MPDAWAVIDDGAVIRSHDANRPVPWWSFTKTVLAAAALVLVRDGAVALDERLPDRPYTLRHLLQHRSGLADYGGSPGYHEAVGRGDAPRPGPVFPDPAGARRLRYPAREGWGDFHIRSLFVR